MYQIYGTTCRWLNIVTCIRVAEFSIDIFKGHPRVLLSVALFKISPKGT